jgi:seryl-tRNA synthetase
LVEDLNNELLQMPNTSISPDVPIGKDDSENLVTKTI